MKALVFGVPSYGHVNPTIPLMKELVKRGVAIVNYNTPSFRPNPAPGITFVSCPILERVDTKSFTKRISLIQLMGILSGIVAELTEFAVSQIEKEKPDFIIHDSFALWGRASAQIIGVPAGSSITTFAFNPQVFWKCPEFLLETIGGSLADLKYLPEIRQSLNSFFLKYGLKAGSLLDYFVNREQVNLVYTSKYFQPGGSSFGPEFKFVGPMLDLGQPPSKQDLIYISLGTIYNYDREFFEICFEALQDMPYKIILSLGNGLNAAFGNRVPKNFEVYQFVDQVKVLQQAALFITHSGMNSTSEGLSMNTPLIMIPQISEQRLVAKRVQDLGGGIRLKREKLDAKLLRRTVLEVLETKSYHDNIAKIRESFIESGGVRRAATEALSLVAHN